MSDKNTQSTLDLIKHFDLAKQVAQKVFVLEQELSRQREILRQLIAGAPTNALESLASVQDSERDESLATRIRLVLKRQPGIALSARDIVVALGIGSDKIQRVREVINHLARKPGVWGIKRVSRGRYQYS